MKYWQKLLTKWKEQGNDGLTIPFIIGSQKYLSASHVNQNIQELLIDIAQNSEHEVYIKYCMNIKEIVLEVNDGSKKIPGMFPPFRSSSQSKLIRTNFVDDLGNNIESIISELFNRYQSNIDSGKFSKNNGEWGNYTGDEIEFIKACNK